MKLPAVPVHGMEDATLNFEALQALGVLGSAISSNVQANVGSVSLSWPASQTATPVSVAHGLGRVPKIVVPFIMFNLTGLVVHVMAYGFTASTFTLGGYGSVVNGNTITVGWLAIG